MMSLSNAINFITSIFVYEPIKTRFTSLEVGDAQGLLNLAKQMGYNLDEDELLLALELTVDHLVLGEAPTPEEIMVWAQERKARLALNPSQPFQRVLMRV